MQIPQSLSSTLGISAQQQVQRFGNEAARGWQTQPPHWSERQGYHPEWMTFENPGAKRHLTRGKL
jgi:hypothetical protein